MRKFEIGKGPGEGEGPCWGSQQISSVVKEQIGNLRSVVMHWYPHSHALDSVGEQRPVPLRSPKRNSRVAETSAQKLGLGSSAAVAQPVCSHTTARPGPPQLGQGRILHEGTVRN